MRIRLAYLLSALLLPIVGCYSCRDSAMVDVGDWGDGIATRHKYRLVGVNIRGDKCDEVLNNILLKSKFPQVFSDRGIPLEVSYPFLVPPQYKYGWSFLLTLFTLDLVPQFVCSTQEFPCDLRLVDDQSVSARFSVYQSFDRADSLFPTGLIPFSDAPDNTGFKVFWRSYKVLPSDDDGGKKLTSRFLALTFGGLREEVSKDAFAYGVVSKLKQLEDSGRIDAMLKKLGAAKSKAPAHKVLKWTRELGSDFTYGFTLELAGEPEDPDKDASAVMKEFGESLKEEYSDSFPRTDKASLIVDYLDVRVDGRIIRGRAAVLTIVPVSLTYDPDTRRGKLSVRFNLGQADEARSWIRKNIETLARDKNIALVTGQLPPAATYYSLGEKIDGNVMEVEFMTE